MKTYLELVRKVLDQGRWKKNRTGVPALTISGAMLEHHLSDGFPLLTTKKIAFRSIRVELEFFIRGLREKSWLQERNCHIWDDWCNPEKIPSALNEIGQEERRKQFQLQENDLGKIYGYQWTNFNGVNQLKNLVDQLKKNKDDRRMIVSSWNPSELKEMALPPCHVLFHVVVIEDEINLTWFQRSCDLALGIPFNLASYGLLLHLLAKESGLKEGRLTGMLSDVHLYQNHIEGMKQQLERTPLPLGRLITEPFNDLWQWKFNHSKMIDYQSHSKINFPISV